MTAVVERVAERRDLVLKSGLASAVVAVGLVVYSAYGDSHPKHQQTSAVPFLSAVAVVGALLAFGLLVPRGLRAAGRGADSAPRWALVPGIVALVLFPLAFWTGLPLVLGSAAALVGSRPRPDGTRVSTAAVVVGGIAVFGGLLMSIVGNTVLSGH
jgi:hypothetical protein